ncbi:MAG: DUF3604 domain-containing protein [Gammaproteobacteria bacterium]|nr:DUF3604 domain-containing protein [Gammaproteobacteria bacterium]
MDVWPQELTDYLTAGLRARIEKLKADTTAVASNPNNLEERTRMLWDWANAYALSGGTLPVDLTRAVATVLASAEVREGQMSDIDGFIEEMTLLDDDPQALGTLRADAGPYQAGSFATVRQTYRVGSRIIQTGGGILVARHFQPNYGDWQTSDAKADNYLSIRSTAGGVSFTSDTLPMRGAHGGIDSPTDALVFRVASGTLQSGDEVTVTYGDRSKGSRGFRMPEFSSDLMPLPLYVAFTGNGRFFTLPLQPLLVTGGGVAGVRGFVPSIVAAGDLFSLTVRSRDAHHNRAVGQQPRWMVQMNGEPFAEIPAGENALTALPDIHLDQPGVYRFTIHSEDGRIRGNANPLLVKAEVGERIFWGDTHGHSGFAEGVGSAARFMNWARDDAQLDFVSHSEHDIWLDDSEWEVLRNNVETYTRQGEFIAFLGYEWTVRNVQGGHHNVLYRTPKNRNRIPAQLFPTLTNFYAGLRASADPADVLIIPHAHQAADYRHSDPQFEQLVEITSQQGAFEWLGRAYLEHGQQIGFTAGSDNHLSQPGYAVSRGNSLTQRGGLGAVLATEKTTDLLFDAMKARRTYATSGERIILDFSVNGVGMGQRAPFSNARTIRGRVVGTAAIDTITLVKNGEEIWRMDLLTQEAVKLNTRETFLLSFTSDSQPHHPGDNPRGWRRWRGSIEILGAELVEATVQDNRQQEPQSLAPDEKNPNRLQFTTITRGNSSSILLSLNKVKRSTQIKIVLEPTAEAGGATPIYRPHQQLAGATAMLSLRDLSRGLVSVNLSVEQYADKIILRRIYANGEMDVSFEFEDTGERQGDYYFMRIRQANEGLAWSSPVWVGGYPKR